MVPPLSPGSQARSTMAAKKQPSINGISLRAPLLPLVVALMNESGVLKGLRGFHDISRCSQATRLLCRVSGWLLVNILPQWV